MATLINFGIFATVLFLALRNPVKQMVRERHRLIKEDVETTRVRLKNAKEIYEEFSAKLRAIDAEIEAVRLQIQKDAEAAKSRIVSSSRTLAGVLVSDAKSNAAHLAADLRNELKTEFGQLIVDKAESFVRAKLTGDDRERIRREFSRQMANASQMETVG